MYYGIKIYLQPNVAPNEKKFCTRTEKKMLKFKKKCLSKKIRSVSVSQADTHGIKKKIRITHPHHKKNYQLKTTPLS